MDGQIIHDVQDARTTHQQDGDIGKEKRSKGKKTKIRVNPKEIIEDHPMLEMNCESKSEQKVLDALCNEMHTSPVSVGNLCLSLWISAYPGTESNPQKREQSIP